MTRRIVGWSLVLTWMIAGGGCYSKSAPTPKPTVAYVPDPELHKQIVAFCADCHGMPPASSFRKKDWAEEVEQGYRFYILSGRKDLEPPPISKVIEYFEEQAPNEAVVENLPSQDVKLTLKQSKLGEPEESAIAHVRWLNLKADQSPVLVHCDMKSGVVAVTTDHADSPQRQVIAQLKHPAHAEACDLDKDGAIDLVVAELGSFYPQDHDKGEVVWLRRTGDPLEFEPITLLDQIGRVADVQPADMDADGDVDLVVAEFGWRTTGSIRLLENVSTGQGKPEFKMHILDERHGAIHVPTADLDGDGDLDIITIVSQEHESVEVLLNDGGNTFRREVIHNTADPAFGSSGIQLVDMDGDKDLDVLYANGDSFDSHFVKHYHGVQWLENRNKYPFVLHELTKMPGVHRALAADMDGDGDQDIVAASLLPQNYRGDYESIVWLEQEAPGKFTRRLIETGSCDHATMEIADFDADGKLDIAVGTYAAFTDTKAAPLKIWWNR